MRKLRTLWRGAFDVREGERLRTLFMALYFLFVLFTHNILKPVSWALFLNSFNINRLAYLYILMALAGGLLAYVYTKAAVRTSLRSAVHSATFVTVVGLVAFWWFIRLDSTWLLYVINVCVNLLLLVFVSQGWLVAANVFHSREAKRLYGLLSLGGVVGAALGGSFTAYTVRLFGTANLLPAGAVMVLLAYASIRAAMAQRGVVVAGTMAAQDEAGNFSFRDMAGALARYRHLLVIVGIISLTYIVEVLVEFQFSSLAKSSYQGDQLTAFLGKFYGIYLSITMFVLQLFFTTLVVGRLGVGGTLKITPVATAAASLGVLAVPHMASAALARLVEAATRHSFTRPAVELLYLPLPSELKNRTKAFIDITVDRLGRGFAGFLLLLLTSFDLAGPRLLSVVVFGFATLWTLLTVWAQKEYLRTVRRRVESRRLDLEGARLTVQDPATVALLERVARSESPRQATYALSLLSEVPKYDPVPLLREMAGSPLPEVRAKVYQMARQLGLPDFLDRALAETPSCNSVAATLLHEAVAYLLTVSPDGPQLAARFIQDPSCRLAGAALDALAERRELLRSLVTKDWLAAAAASEDPNRRALAAFAIGVRGDEGTGALHQLLADPASPVVAAACRSAGRLRNLDYFPAVVARLADGRLRDVAIESLVCYGEDTCGELARMLEDESVPVAIRCRIPRVVAGLPFQASVDGLHRCIGQTDLSVRTAVLKALNRLRERAPNLDYRVGVVMLQIRKEAQSYFELHAALTRFRQGDHGGKATALLMRTLEERLQQTIGRLFRLLGLCYPPRQIYAAYLAVSHHRAEEFATALDFLDNILDQDLKRILLPVIDGSPHLLDIGRDVFGVDVPDLEAAIRQQVLYGDTWLAACATAAAAELKLHGLAHDIARAAQRGGPEVAQVARRAAAALA